MPETLVTRTFSEGLRPLGTASQRNPALIAETLRTHLTPAHVLLFCEPSPTPDGVATDWYAQCVGVVRQLDSLDAEEASAARTRLGELVGDILDLADRLEAGGGQSDRRLAEALRNGVEVPASDAIWLVGDQPLLVTWGYARDIDKAPRGIIRRYIPARPPSPPPPASQGVEDVVAVPGRQRSASDVLWWLGWLLLAGLVMLVFWLLVAPCAVVLPGLSPIGRCPPAPSMAIVEERDILDTLENRVAMLERELALLDGNCREVPDEVTDTAEDDVTDPVTDDVTDTVLAEGGTLGAVNIILSWQGSADLDLSVRCPDGRVIDYQNKRACGGELDIDANVSFTMPAPVENIVFEDVPGAGTYPVRVHLFDYRNDDRGAPKHFTLTVIIDGEETVHNGSVDSDNERWRTDVAIGGV